MSQSIENKIVSRIYGNKRAWVFTPNHFLDLGSRTAVAQSLVRLAKSGTIRRLTRGLYDNLKIQPSGAYAANLLGLTEQVPAKIVFFTDGPNRKVQIGKQKIVLKRTTPKNMATAGRISGLVIQALRYLKQINVDSIIIAKLKRRLSDEDKSTLMSDIRYAPVWIGNIFRKIQE